jgi:hypothetical protein
MTAQTLELVALAVAEMNGAFIPRSEAFLYRNPGKLREANGNLRMFSTWAGGLKSLISDLSRWPEYTPVLTVFEKYGCDSIEKEFVVLDYLGRAADRELSQESTLSDVETPKEGN